MFGIKKIIKNKMLSWKYRKKHISIDSSAKIGVSTFEGYNRISRRSSFKGYMGLGTYISAGCRLSAKIGRFTSIGPSVVCNPGTHPYKEPYATTSPFFFSLQSEEFTFAKEQMFEEYLYAEKEQKIAVEIGNDCWIGEGVFIVGGVHISDGAVVLASAVVTKDVPAYAIVGGVPAKVIGYRYDQATIDFLLKIKWWNNSEEWLKKNWLLLCDIQKLKQFYNSSSNERYC